MTHRERRETEERGEPPGGSEAVEGLPDKDTPPSPRFLREWDGRGKRERGSPTSDSARAPCQRDDPGPGGGTAAQALSLTFWSAVPTDVRPDSDARHHPPPPLLPRSPSPAPGSSAASPPVCRAPSRASVAGPPRTSGARAGPAPQASALGRRRWNGALGGPATLGGARIPWAEPGAMARA